MKTITIILSTILLGFCFYVSDPDIMDAPAQIMCIIGALTIGIMLGNKTPKHLKTNEEVDKIASMAVKDVAVIGHDNVICHKRINELEAEIRQLKNDLENNRMNEGRLRKEIVGLKSDLAQANRFITDSMTPLISETV